MASTNDIFKIDSSYILLKNRILTQVNTHTPWQPSPIRLRGMLSPVYWVSAVYCTLNLNESDTWLPPVLKTTSAHAAWGLAFFKCNHDDSYTLPFNIMLSNVPPSPTSWADGVDGLRGDRQVQSVTILTQSVSIVIGGPRIHVPVQETPYLCIYNQGSSELFKLNHDVVLVICTHP